MDTEGRIRLSSLLRGAAPLLARARQVVHGYRLANSGDVERCHSIGAILETNARLYPDQPALRFEGEDISHAELNARANRLAHLLIEAGVKHGDPVGVLMENRPELIIAVAGIVKLGAIAVVHNHRLPAPSLAHCLDLVPARQLIVGCEAVQTWQAASKRAETQLEAEPLWVSDRDSDETRPEGFRDLQFEMHDFPTENPDATDRVRLGDVCFYVFTSGTTGLPKAAVIRHIRWIKAMGAFGFMALGFKPGQVLYNVLPLYHNTALAVGWSACAATGACLAIGRRFSASSFIDELRENNADGFVYIGELCRFLLNQPPDKRDRDHHARAMVGNGLRPGIWDEFKQRFGIEKVFELYGASEANIAFFNIFNQDRTVGYCPAEYALVACDPETGEVRRNESGRLSRIGRGQTGLLLGKVTRSYPYDGYTDTRASEDKLIRDAFEEGDAWFNTGDLLMDLGFKHARFVDRLGDTYRWRGENVATTEVESVAMALPEIEQAVAYGVQVPETEGRAGMLAFQAASDATAEQAVGRLASQFRENLADYAIPIFLRQVEAVDATGTFKFIKADLKREGFDPDQINNPLWIRLPGENTYTPLTPDHHRSLMDGELGL